MVQKHKFTIEGENTYECQIDCGKDIDMSLDYDDQWVINGTLKVKYKKTSGKNSTNPSHHNHSDNKLFEKEIDKKLKEIYKKVLPKKMLKPDVQFVSWDESGAQKENCAVFVLESVFCKEILVVG
ncbi:MAG: hypothetical protein Edafosvirus1_1, partial [Edafosvirus sp.]